MPQPDIAPELLAAAADPEQFGEWPPEVVAASWRSLPEALREALAAVQARVDLALQVAATGERYAAHGHVRLREVDGVAVTATCIDDNGSVYNVGRALDGWWCDCPRTNDLPHCEHQYALLHVINPPPASEAP